MTHKILSVGLCLLLVTSLAQGANSIKVENTVALAGQQDLVVRILADNDAPVMGVSIAGGIPNGLTLDSVTIAGTDLAADALDAEYFQELNGADYFGMAVIIDFNTPYDWRTLAVGTDNHIMSVYFDVDSGLATGMDLAIDLSDAFGDPPISPVFTVDGATITPELLDGVVTITAEPEVTGVSLTWAATAGGNAITVEGTDFTDDTAVTVDGTALANLQFVNATTITGEVPAHAAGTAAVTATNSIGSDTLDNAFTYVDPPTVASVNPSTGRGNVLVTITGTNFTDTADTTVTVGGAATTNVTVVSATELTGELPPCGAAEDQWLEIAVTTTGGTGSLTEGYFCTAGDADITFLRGDSNCDGTADIADAIKILGYLFGTPVADCLDAMDANDDGATDIADAITVLGHLFSATGPLPAPFPDPGIDPTDDGLDCAVQCGPGPQ